MLYKAVMQSVLLYGSSILVGIGDMLKSTRGIPSSGRKKDYGYDGAKYGKRRVGVPPSG